MIHRSVIFNCYLKENCVDRVHHNRQHVFVGIVVIIIILILILYFFQIEYSIGNNRLNENLLSAPMTSVIADECSTTIKTIPIGNLHNQT